MKSNPFARHNSRNKDLAESHRLTHENSAESPTPTPIQKRGDPLDNRQNAESKKTT